MKEFVEACKKATGVDIKVDYLERRAGDYAEVYSDPRKIKEELNWTAKHTNLQESLKMAWRWQLEKLTSKCRSVKRRKWTQMSQNQS